MTRVMITTSCAGVKAAYTKGQEAEVDDITARDLVQAGYAELLPDLGPASPPAAPKRRRVTAKKTGAKADADTE